MEVFTKTFLGGITMGMIKDKFLSTDEKRGTNNAIPKGEKPQSPGKSIDGMGAIRYPFHPIDDKSKESVKEKEDMVNHPKHYKIEGISEEVIDICEAMIKDITRETGNPVLASHIAVVIQYVMRAHKKNGKEDYRKAIWYLNRAIATMEGEKDMCIYELIKNQGTITGTMINKCLSEVIPTLLKYKLISLNDGDLFTKSEDLKEITKEERDKIISELKDLYIKSSGGY